MIANVNLFAHMSLLDISLVFNALWLTATVYRLCEKSQTKLGWASLLLLIISLPVSFVVYGLLGHSRTLGMVELAGMRICLITGLLCGSTWLNKTLDARFSARSRRGVL